MFLPIGQQIQQFPLSTTHRLWSCQRHKHLHRPFNNNYTHRLPMIKNSSLIGLHQQAIPLIKSCSHSHSPTIIRRDFMKTNSNILTGVTGNIRLLSIRRQWTTPTIQPKISLTTPLGRLIIQKLQTTMTCNTDVCNTYISILTPYLCNSDRKYKIYLAKINFSLELFMFAVLTTEVSPELL